MALKVIVTSEEYAALDEAVQALYKEGASKELKGSYVLDISGVDTHPEVIGLKKTLAKYRDLGDPDAAKRSLATATSLQEAIGELDAEGVKAALLRLKELEEMDPKERTKKQQDEIERITEGLKKAHEKELKKIQDEVANLATQVSERDSFIEGLVIDNALESGMTKIKVLDHFRPAVKALLRSRKPKVIREEENGEVNYKGIFMTDLGETDILTFVEKWGKDDEAEPFLPPSGNTGSGGKTTGDGGTRLHKGNNPFKKETFNLTEQGKIKRDNPQLARQLAAAAGVSLD